MKPRLRLLPGTVVLHAHHGLGTVLGEWGPIDLVGMTETEPARRAMCACHDVYDVIFGTGENRYLHCCRIEFLEWI